MEHGKVNEKGCVSQHICIAMLFFFICCRVLYDCKTPYVGNWTNGKPLRGQKTTKDPYVGRIHGIRSGGAKGAPPKSAVGSRGGGPPAVHMERQGETQALLGLIGKNMRINENPPWPTTAIVKGREAGLVCAPSRG